MFLVGDDNYRSFPARKKNSKMTKWFIKATGHFEGIGTGIPVYTDLGTKTYLYPSMFMAHFSPMANYTLFTFHFTLMQDDIQEKEENQNGIPTTQIYS